MCEREGVGRERERERERERFSGALEEEGSVAAAEPQAGSQVPTAGGHGGDWQNCPFPTPTALPTVPGSSESAQAPLFRPLYKGRGRICLDTPRGLLKSLGRQVSWLEWPGRAGLSATQRWCGGGVAGGKVAVGSHIPQQPRLKLVSLPPALNPNS